MAGRRLAVTVVLRDPATGKVTSLLAGAEAPHWAEDLITNDEVWADAADSIPDGQDGDGEDRGDGAGGDTPAEPPRSGKGSGVEAWREYADAVGVEVADDATRDDIIAAVDAAAQG